MAGRYAPIGDYGIIGDLHTVALVGTDGTIDWFCPERFDFPSVFAAILDKGKGGHYRIAPEGDEYTTKQLYFPDTNVLITRFLTPDGVGEVQDFMAIHRDPHHRRRLIRRVLCVRGEMRLCLVSTASIAPGPRPVFGGMPRFAHAAPKRTASSQYGSPARRRAPPKNTTLGGCVIISWNAV